MFERLEGQFDVARFKKAFYERVQAIVREAESAKVKEIKTQIDGLDRLFGGGGVVRRDDVEAILKNNSK